MVGKSVRDLSEKPRQGEFKAHSIIKDFHRSCRRLSECTDSECQAVISPYLLLDRDHACEILAGTIQPRFEAPYRFVAAKVMGSKEQEVGS
jgi:hypothetical protein